MMAEVLNRIKINKNLELSRDGIVYHDLQLRGRYYINYHPTYGLSIKVLNNSNSTVVASLPVKMSERRAISIMNSVHRDLNKDRVMYRLPLYITKEDNV